MGNVNKISRVEGDFFKGFVLSDQQSDNSDNESPGKKSIHMIRYLRLFGVQTDSLNFFSDISDYVIQYFASAAPVPPTRVRLHGLS